MKSIQYHGPKVSKRDNVARTGLVWMPGQVHFVSDEAAQKLLAYPSIWREVSHEETQTEARTGETPPVLKMLRRKAA